MREIMTNISLFILLWNGVVRYCNYHIRDLLHYQTGLNIGIIMLIVLLVASVDEKIDLSKTKLRGSFWIGWTACFLLMFLMATVNPVEQDYLIWSLISVFVFPLLLFIWGQGSKQEKFCKATARIAVILSYIFMAMSVAIVPFVSKAGILQTSAYLGMAPNPNNNGILCTAFFGAALYLFFTENQKKPIYLISMGFSIAVSVISVSRTAELAILLQSLFGLAYYSKGCREDIFKRLSFRTVMLSFVIVAITAFSCGYLLRSIDDIDLNAHAATEETLSAGESQESVADKINRFSSGRLDIWKAYITEATFFGNGTPKEPVMKEYSASRWAHNNALDILYISGVIPFLGYVLWIFSVLVFIFKSITGKTTVRKEYLYLVIIFMGYFTQAMLEITLFPMTTNITMLLYIGLAPAALRE